MTEKKSSVDAHPDDVDSDHTLHWVSVDGFGEDWRRLLRAIVRQCVHLQRTLCAERGWRERDGEGEGEGMGEGRREEEERKCALPHPSLSLPHLEQSHRFSLQFIWVSGALSAVESEGLGQVLEVVEGLFQIIGIDLMRN